MCLFCIYFVYCVFIYLLYEILYYMKQSFASTLEPWILTYCNNAVWCILIAIKYSFLWRGLHIIQYTTNNMCVTTKNDHLFVRIPCPTCLPHPEKISLLSVHAVLLHTASSKNLWIPQSIKILPHRQIKYPVDFDDELKTRKRQIR